MNDLEIDYADYNSIADAIAPFSRTETLTSDKGFTITLTTIIGYEYPVLKKARGQGISTFFLLKPKVKR